MRRLISWLAVAGIVLAATDAAAQRRGGGDRGDRDRGGFGRPDGEGGPSFMGRGGGPPGMMGSGGGPPGMGFRGGGPPGMMGGGGPPRMMGFRGGGPSGMIGSGGGPPGGGFRGGGPPGGGFRGGGPPGRGEGEDRMARFEGFLRSMDRNGNGVIEESEVPEERRRMISGIAERLGLEVKDGGVAISKIREAAEKRSQAREREREKEPQKEQEPLVPGFGVDQELPRVPAFGERVEYASVLTLGSSSGKSAASADPEEEARTRGFAQMMIMRNDRNGSGALEREEWEGMRRDPSPADRDKNGVVTLDELTKSLTNRSRGGSDGGGANGSGSNGSGSNGSNGRRSYRFLSANERLAEGLPDWFTDSDANSDGQVAMFEYSSYWTEERAREFNRHDRNDDGVITQQECLRGPVESDELASPDVGPSESPREESPREEDSAGAEKPWWEL